MKKIIILSIAILFFALSLAHAESVYNFFRIRHIKIISIEVFAKDDWKTPVKTISIQNDETIKKITALLKKLPSTGEVNKKFGKGRIIKIKLISKGNKIDELTIYGPRLRVPDDSGKGSFYSGPTETESKFVALVESIIGND
ncbi:MAG: hypothetical protein HQ558_00755 [Candidatus Omnitrophica bacterium]|nr:hypothetical protein [Candidatus Omnitrophota bacterium]